MLACGDGNPIIGIIGYNLYRRHIAIQDKEKAFDIFGKLENNQLIEKYKGYIIEHRIDTKDLSYVYVSNVYRTCKGYYCYSHSIKEIKNIIDKKVRIKENNDVVRIKKMVVS